MLSKPVTPSGVAETVTGIFAPAPARKRTRGAESHSWECLTGRHVLLVEDNPINQEVVHDLLEAVGVQVTTAGDGVEALRILDNRRFDAVLMDVHMPVMNGFETTAAIRRSKRFPAMPIIALTANALDGDRDRCLEAGMDDYVPKPIDPKQMFATLARHCAPGARDADSANAPPLQDADTARDARCTVSHTRARRRAGIAEHDGARRSLHQTGAARRR